MLECEAVEEKELSAVSGCGGEHGQRVAAEIQMCREAQEENSLTMDETKGHLATE